MLKNGSFWRRGRPGGNSGAIRGAPDVDVTHAGSGADGGPRETTPPRTAPPGSAHFSSFLAAARQQATDNRTSFRPRADKFSIHALRTHAHRAFAHAPNTYIPATPASFKVIVPGVIARRAPPYRVFSPGAWCVLPVLRRRRGSAAKKKAVVTA